ncbi:hypothetical protein [Aromatoleum bremense]|uniref:Uncharacterized protein n=1 Tax=Aromatoleum bremense TaxID=76115 RepID=A0ABX1NTC1_9RHOO|nr:hypothetical protein [Aromatoleum bremense]NMG15229.1 hypothetical protein [Aromatoleum bremense]QTQ33369.1 Uncharacterized protein pbN1_33830 [Aromatoleum bremense]
MPHSQPQQILSRPRSALAAWLMMALVLLSLAYGARTGLPAWPAGLAAWGAGIALWPRLDHKQHRFAIILSGLGAVALAVALWRGHSPSWSGLLTKNTPLLGMLAAVSFLQLVGMGRDDDRPLPRGRRALWQTMAGVHVFGAVINMSVIFIVAERLAQSGRLSLRQAAAITRAFMLAALWSPFFGAMAVALTYAPHARLADVALAGAPLAAVLVWVAGRTLPPAAAGEDPDFVGFPMRPSALWLPLALTVVVSAAHFLLPAWSSLAIISGAALAISVAAVFVRSGPGEGVERIIDHAHRRLPAMSGELMLFLAAGVLATGLQALMQADSGWLPFEHFGPLQAAVVLGLMIALSAIGVHAVVTIVIASAWLAPLAPDPLLLALMFLMSWGIGLALNPMAGVHLSLQGRFALPALGLARANLRYCVAAYALAVVWLFGVALVRGVL